MQQILTRGVTFGSMRAEYLLSKPVKTTFYENAATPWPQSRSLQDMVMQKEALKAVDIDFLTTGTYKWLLGGFGVAPFYVREALLDSIAIDRMGSLHIANDLGEHRYELHSDGRKYGYATMAFGAVF